MQTSVSPHYVASLAGGDSETKAKTRGSIIHAAMLEPDRFDAEYAIGPSVDLRTKAGKSAWEAFAAENPGKELVRGADGDAMLAARASIWKHPKARELLGCEEPRRLFDQSRRLDIRER